MFLEMLGITGMATLIKAKLKKSDVQTNIENHILHI